MSDFQRTEAEKELLANENDWLNEIESAAIHASKKECYYDIETLTNCAEQLYKLRLRGKEHDETSGAEFVARFLRKSEKQMVNLIKSTRKMINGR